MKIAIDKNCLSKINKLKKFKNCELIYIFEDEDIQDLLKLGLHCIHISCIKQVDINLTNYTLQAIKKIEIENISEQDIPKKKDYKFCIIIPNCNNDHGDVEGKTFLQKCIESVLNQTYKNFEIIVVDDMSTDTSVKTIQKYTEEDRRIQIFENTYKRYNGGSRNVGIEIAQQCKVFDYYYFMDSDDWLKDENTLQKINDNLWDCELMLIGCEMIFPNGTTQTHINNYETYEDFFLSDNKVWCTAWSRVIRKDKIVYFPESTLMEDRTWSYEQADNVNLENVRNLEEVCYTWNRLNTTNSVSLTRGKVWEASAYKHIGQQKMLIEKLKHKEMIPILHNRIKTCLNNVVNGIYTQY